MLAAAFTELDNNNETVSVQIFSVVDGDKFKAEIDRSKFKIPKLEQPPKEEVKTTGCEYHDRKNAEKNALNQSQTQVEEPRSWIS